MEITVIIEESLFEEPVRRAAANEINKIVREKVERFITRYTNSIEAAIEVYLDKRLTDKMIKHEIDTAVKNIIESRLRDNLDEIG